MRKPGSGPPGGAGGRDCGRAACSSLKSSEDSSQGWAAGGESFLKVGVAGRQKWQGTEVGATAKGSREVEKPARWEHFKGLLVRIVCVCVRSPTAKKLGSSPCCTGHRTLPVAMPV